jgi:hypothetical protein
MKLRLSRIYIFALLIILSTAQSALSSNGSQGGNSGNENGDGNIGAFVVKVATVAVGYLVFRYAEVAGNKAYHWISGTESPEELQLRLLKELKQAKDEEAKLTFLNGEAHALVSLEKVRKDFLAEGVISSQKNKETTEKHLKILDANIRIREKRRTVSELIEKKQTAQINSDGSITLKDFAGKAR